MLSALKTMGMEPEGLSHDHVSTILSARDYAEAFLAKKKFVPRNYKLGIAMMAIHLVQHREFHEWLRDWSWKERNRGSLGDPPKRIPENEVRTAAEAILAQIERR
jgi:hypothetical protein